MTLNNLVNVVPHDSASACRLAATRRGRPRVYNH